MNINIIKPLIVIVTILLTVTPVSHTHAQAAQPDQALSNQFFYGYKNEVAFGNKPGFELDANIEDLAMVLNKHLNQSILFDTSFVANAKNVRKHLENKKRPVKDFVGTSYKIMTDDGIQLNATYFDRGSDTLLVIAEGFANTREYMAPFIAMFHDYDVVIFDFRGHGIQEGWSLSFARKGFGIDSSLVTLGHKEDKDVHAIVDGFKKLKSYDKKTKQYDKAKGYKNVFGLGLCYGAFVLTKAQATSPVPLFDKLVLDGCWHSLELFTNKIKLDLYTIWSPQTGGWSNHWFFGNGLVQDVIESFVKNFLLEIKDISLLDYAGLIDKTPILYIHGKDDYMIYKPEFEQLWNAFATPQKTAFLTSNPHVRNHWKQKELYKLTCDLFFENPYEQFTHYLQNSQDIATYYANKYARKIRALPNA